MEENKDKDHKKIGREMELFTFSDSVGKGLPIWLPKGATVRRELERFIVDEEIRRGYLHVRTPDIAKLDLYKKSGHYPHYQDSMYAPIVIDDEEFMLRPMTCPHHFELYLHKPHSYRELPMRIAELAQLYRYEQSGELMGLQRVRTFCLADAHIICKDETQAIEEIGNALDLIEYVTSVFNLKLDVDYRYRLSLGDRDNHEKYYKNDEAWEKGEDLMRKLMQKRGSKFEEAKDEAAFYGPKIDIQMKNVNGKEDTAFTVQYDFCMPKRFELKYMGEDGNEHQAFVVHRSSIGAIERIMAFLIEKYAGAFPLWLSPTQVAIVPVRENHEEEAEKINQLLKNNSIRVQILHSGDSIGKRINHAKAEKIPYVIVLGDKEMSANTLTVEKRDGTKIENISPVDFLKELQEKINSKSLEL
ncbi:threonine--tRNA ligase [Candidatus Nomurabacteria bacterium]|nr:threonine--tRNA ligase [Candidatus Nomurabacteria bacterium]